MWPFKKRQFQLLRERREYKRVGGQSLSAEVVRADAAAGPPVICLQERGGEEDWPDADFLAQAGFTLARVEFRRTPCTELESRLSDVADGLLWLLEHSHIDGRRGAGLWGHGLGGPLAALISLPSVRHRWVRDDSPLQELPVKAVVDSCSPSGLYLDLLFADGPPQAGKAQAYWEQQSSLFSLRASRDRGAVARSVALNPVNSISEMECPYLLCHTTDEERWSLSDRTRYYRECRSQGANVFLLVENRTPGAPKLTTAAACIEAFFKRSLRRKKTPLRSQRVMVCGPGPKAKRFSDLVCPTDTGFADYLTVDSWKDPIHWTPPGTEYGVFRSSHLKEEVSYLTALPPSYRDHPQRRYPVSYWLYPTLQGPRSLAEEVVPLLQSAYSRGSLPETVAVFVNHCYFKTGKAVDTGHSRINQMIAHELTRHIDQQYRTEACRRSRTLVGHSGSGPLAMALALRFPKVFSGVNLFAPAYCGSLVSDLEEASSGQLPRVLLVYGQKEEIASLHEGFAKWRDLLDLHQIDASVRVAPEGKHSIASLFQEIEKSPFWLPV